MIAKASSTGSATRQPSLQPCTFGAPGPNGAGLSPAPVPSAPRSSRGPRLQPAGHISLFKDFATLSERYKFQFRSKSSTSLNHPDLQCPRLRRQRRCGHRRAPTTTSIPVLRAEIGSTRDAPTIRARSSSLSSSTSKLGAFLPRRRAYQRRCREALSKFQPPACPARW